MRGVDLCVTAKPTRPLARLRLELETATNVYITLATGAGYQSAFGRAPRSELTAVPLDARLLAIAVATDELLAANWSEIERRAHTTTPPPRAALVAPPLPPAPPREPNFELGPVFVFEAFGGGLQQLGVDVRGALRFVPRLALTARGGRAPRLTAPERTRQLARDRAARRLRCLARGRRRRADAPRRLHARRRAPAQRGWLR